MIVLYRLFAIALLFGALANIFPLYLGMPLVGEFFEVITIGFIGAIGWELFRTKPWRGKNGDNDDGSLTISHDS